MSNLHTTNIYPLPPVESFFGIVVVILSSLNKVVVGATNLLCTILHYSLYHHQYLDECHGLVWELILEVPRPNSVARTEPGNRRCEPMPDHRSS